MAADTEATGVVEAARSPVHGDEPEKLEQGVALCLSGGGFRAMLFHAGAVWRLNELGYLPKLNRISSVSGGSITNGVLAMNWAKLRYDNGVANNLEEQLIQPIRKLASTTIDKGAVIKGILLPARSSTESRAPTATTSSAGPACRSPGRATLRLQRDQHADRLTVAVLEAVHGRLPGRRGAEPGCGARRCRRRVFGVPADPLSRRTGHRPEQLGSHKERPAARAALHDKAVPQRRRRVRQPRARNGVEALHHESSSATAAGRWDRSQARNTTGRDTHTARSA